MIKDTILPSIPVCEVIIKDNNFHELLILKNLFSKPENFEKWSRLKPCFQRVIIEVQSGRQSPVLDMLQSNIVSKPLRPVRAQTDPTLVRL